MGEAGYFHVTQDLLFQEEAPKCDVCGEPLESAADDDESPPGRGLYVWSRGGESVYEEVPLCAVCGAAIGMSALLRWEIEEEEG
jgi:hypothetical protein